MGAYGIVKHGGRSGGVKLWEQQMQNSEDTDDLGLAVQVSTYFIRDNAMGIVDGVGGC